MVTAIQSCSVHLKEFGNGNDNQSRIVLIDYSGSYQHRAVLNRGNTPLQYQEPSGAIDSVVDTRGPRPVALRSQMCVSDPGVGSRAGMVHLVISREKSSACTGPSQATAQ